MPPAAVSDFTPPEFSPGSILAILSQEKKVEKEQQSRKHRLTEQHVRLSRRTNILSRELAYAIAFVYPAVRTRSK